MQLLKGHTVLKSSPILGGKGLIYRYRLTLDLNNQYTVHRECLEPTGQTLEAFLYKGLDLDAANFVFDRQTSL